MLLESEVNQVRRPEHRPKTIKKLFSACALELKSFYAKADILLFFKMFSAKIVQKKFMKLIDEKCIV